jgi:hypothetical protein
MLKSALSGLAAIGIVTVGIHFITKGFGDLAEFNQKVEGIKQGIKDPAAQFKGMTKKQVEERQSEMRKEATGLRAQIAEDQKPDSSAAAALRRLIPSGLLQLAGQKTDLDVTREKLLRPGQLKELEAALKVDPSKFADKPKPTVFDPLNPDGTGGTGGTGTDKAQARIGRADEIVRRLQDQLRIQESQGKIGQVIAKQAKERSDLEARFQALLKDGEDKKILEAQTDARKLLIKKQSLELERRIEEVIERSTKPLEDITKNIHEKIRADKEYARLIAEGVNPELAKQLIEIDKQFLASKDLLDLKIEEAKASLVTLQNQEGTTEAIEAQIKAIQDLEKARKGLPEEAGRAKTAAGEAHADETFLEGLDKHIGEIERNLKKLIDPLKQVKDAGEAIGAAFKNSFKGLIDGSMTAKEAMASFLESVADHFADMAAEIAAEAVKLAAMQFVKFIISSFAGSQIGSGAGAPVRGATAPNTNLPYYGPAFAEGGYIPGGFKAFNQGGMVSQPTLGLVGEGGEPEYIIPQSKMRESMSRYSRGSRGDGVIPSGGGSSASGDGGVAVAAPIDVRYTVERINSVDYVTADQFQNGMQSAAAQGAQRGEQNTLKRLQMSGSTRKRLGL